MRRVKDKVFENEYELINSTYSAMDHHHVLRITVQPGLHSLADGAHLIKKWSMEIRPPHIHNLQLNK